MHTSRIYVAIQTLEHFIQAMNHFRPPFVALTSQQGNAGEPPKAITAVSARFVAQDIIYTFDCGPNIEGADRSLAIQKAADTVGIPLFRGRLSVHEPSNAVDLYCLKLREDARKGDDDRAGAL